ncbi:MAG: hypothetical protein JSS38_00530 [Nitrospira sp.]|nr:hypothetical protein [Nitrospira sp.]MBS0153055.1 hypothetical protein [Nitrospira sp.]MBS0167236.1 hypothetical protein [Nitrospira sp.]
MVERLMERIGDTYRVVVVLIGIGVASVAGCAADSPKPAPIITQDQVKGNADKLFERLKQEENNRTAGSGPAPY